MRVTTGDIVFGPCSSRRYVPRSRAVESSFGIKFDGR
jgi:hypothetical protein